MGRKILIISPTPTHPTNAGNRIRILNMASFLISQGHEVHFLYSRQENADEEAMKKFWGDRFYAVDYEKPELTSREKLLRAIRLRLNHHYQYYCSVDEHYNVHLDEKIRELNDRHRYDTVLAEYIFQSKAFSNFDKGVLKIIDTHDVMTDRHKLFLKEGKKPVWYSTPFREEKKGVRRADVIIAIQEREKEHFRRMTRKKVINVGHIVKVAKAFDDQPEKKLLFVGSNNPSNHYGILEFLDRDFPKLREVYPDMELLIAGNICGRLEQVPAGVRLLGEVDNLEAVYDMVDFVINPLTIGTGLKIKMIEAMGFSKVVFSTPVGAEGLENSVERSFLIYRNSRELLDALGIVFTNPSRYRELCINAARTAEDWNRKNGSGLIKLFQQEGSLDSWNTEDEEKNIEIARPANIAEITSKDPDIQRFVVISIPRSGSNLLMGMMAGHREIICYSELYHKERIYDSGLLARFGVAPFDKELRDREPLTFLNYVYNLKFKKRTKAIGFKIFPEHNDELMWDLIAEPSIKKIVLVRENYLKNYLSVLTASKTNLYFVKVGSDVKVEDIPVHVDFSSFLRYEEESKLFFKKVLDKLNDNNQVYLMVFYEQLLQPAHQSRILNFLGVNPDPEMLVIKSKKQSELPIEQKVSNYHELAAQLKECGKEQYLKPENL